MIEELSLILPAWAKTDMTDDEFLAKYGPGLRGAGFDSVVWTTGWNDPPTRKIRLWITAGDSSPHEQ